MKARDLAQSGWEEMEDLWRALGGQREARVRLVEVLKV